MEGDRPVPTGAEGAARSGSPAGATPGANADDSAPVSSSAPARGFLSKEQILKAQDMGYTEVEVPEWGGVVRLKMLTSRERDAFEGSFERPDPKTGKTVTTYDNIRARLIRMTAVNPDGSLMFEEEDEGWLGDKSSAAADRVYTASARFSKLGKKDIEEILKNSSGAR